MELENKGTVQIFCQISQIGDQEYCSESGEVGEQGFSVQNVCEDGEVVENGCC